MITFTDRCQESGRTCVNGTCTRTGEPVTVRAGFGGRGAVIVFADGFETYADHNELTETP